MKKFLMIALVMTGVAFATASHSNAGISVGIGIGVPGYGYGYPCGGYGYGYGYGYPYRSYYGYQPVVYSGPSFYWYHGHRVYYTRHRHHRVYR